MRFAVALFKFFASLALAILLLVSLGLVFTVGTFVESAYGTEAAKLLIYENRWLSFLLILLALNVAAAALDRLPWKKKHVGFVTTHVGIIAVLAGALVTRAYGVEGQMMIQEGETMDRMVLAEPVLQLFSEETNRVSSLELPRHAFPWSGRTQLTSNPELWLLHSYPKASREEKVEETENGPAALQVILQSSWMNVSHWLFLDDPARGEIFLGPAELRFSREKITAPSPGFTGEGFLEFRFKRSASGNDSIKIPLPPDFSEAVSLPGTPYRVTVLRLLKDAVVDQGELVDRSQEWKNPAVELLLEGEGVKEKHTVFSNFPDFPTLHGMKPSEAGVQIFYQRLDNEPGRARNELHFVWQEGKPPLFQIRKGETVSEGEAEIGKDSETGWMDFKFRLERYLPHSKVESLFREEPVQSGAEGHLAAVELELEAGGERRSFWLGEGEHEEVRVGGKSFETVFGRKTLPVGFQLELRDFRVENYPGTNRPASFESDVTLRDDSTGTVREMTIGMNRPLTYRGFKVFQSGYQQPEGQPEISIFTVAKDPGIPVKYGGALILIGGILTMFYTRRFSNRPEPK